MLRFLGEKERVLAKAPFIGAQQTPEEKRVTMWYFIPEKKKYR